MKYKRKDEVLRIALAAFGLSLMVSPVLANCAPPLGTYVGIGGGVVGWMKAQGPSTPGTTLQSIQNVVLSLKFTNGNALGAFTLTLNGVADPDVPIARAYFLQAKGDISPGNNHWDQGSCLGSLRLTATAPTVGVDDGGGIVTSVIKFDRLYTYTTSKNGDVITLIERDTPNPGKIYTVKGYSISLERH